MGDGKKQNPLTRDDVLRVIKENGGTAKGLDLSWKYFVEEIDLSNEDLHDIILNDTELIHANFNGSVLDGALFLRANLKNATFNSLNSKHSSLVKANFSGAYLKNTEFKLADLAAAQFQEVTEEGDLTKLLRTTFDETDFRNANLFGTKFAEKSKLYRTKLEGACIEGSNIEEALLGDSNWGNYVIGEEKKGSYNFNLAIAEHRYRHLKQWFSTSGYYDTAANFYYREKEASRKAAKRLRDKIAGWLSWAVFGHGERWRRILIWMAGVILGLGIFYFLVNSVWTWSAFWRSLYFSAVSFTAVGYGGWINEKWINIKSDWIIGFGVTETVLGVFMMALLLVTFVRKWTR